MSLKHILNDDPAPPVHVSAPATHAPVPTPAIDPALMRPSPPSRTESSHSDLREYAHSRSPHEAEQQQGVREYAFQPVTYGTYRHLRHSVIYPHSYLQSPTSYTRTSAQRLLRFPMAGSIVLISLRTAIRRAATGESESSPKMTMTIIIHPVRSGYVS